MTDRYEFEQLLATAHNTFVCLDDLRRNRLALSWWYGFGAGAGMVGAWWGISELLRRVL